MPDFSRRMIQTGFRGFCFKKCYEKNWIVLLLNKIDFLFSGLFDHIKYLGIYNLFFFFFLIAKKLMGNLFGSGS